MTDSEFESITFDLGAFRYAAAAYVKFLIRARWKIEPGFLSEDDLGRWKLSDIRDDTRSASQLLLRAGALLAELNTKYISRCGSGGVAEYDLSTPEGRLMDNIAFLADIEGGGPYHNGEVISAALRQPEDNAAAWDLRVNWSTLDEIRNDLDRLPHPYSASNQRQDDNTAVNIFRRTTTGWNIRFQGGRLFAVKGGGGPTYLHRLLSSPDAKIDVRELSQEWNRFQAAHFKRADQEEGLSSDDLNNEPIVDTETFAKCKSEFKSIRVERAKAEKNNDVASLTRLGEEERALLIQLTEWYTPKGRIRKLDPRNKKTRDKVSAAINRLITKLDTEDASLGQHLQRYVTTGWECSYAPPSKVDWSL